MNNGLSETNEIEVRKQARVVTKAIRRLEKALEKDEWDFQELEAIMSQLAGPCSYIANSITRALGTLYANGQIERIAGLPIRLDSLSSSNQTGNLSIDSYIQELLDKKYRKHDDNDR